MSIILCNFAPNFRKERITTTKQHTYMATNDLIVAIELGSSKIAGAVGRKRPDGSLQVVAYANEPASGFVRRGVVYNIDKTAQCLTDLINRLEPEVNNATIEQAYVGVGGYTLHSELNTVVRTFEEETRVSDAIVTAMEEENATKEYPGHNILIMVSQEYKIGNNALNDPVGVNCTRVEGSYLNILARTSVMDNTGKSFELAKVNIANDSIAPLVSADVLLTDNERRQGCVLIDFGADTTTVSVYKGGYLRFLTVIPMGGQSITRDLCSLQLDEQEAERIKREFGLVFPTSSDETVQVDASRSIEVRKVYDVIEARFEEIMLNVCHQIEASGYELRNLLAGVVCCGGGINMKGLESVLAQKFHSAKVRLARETAVQVDWDTAECPDSGTQGVLVGLLMAGEDGCFQEIQMDIKLEDYKDAKQGEIFTADGESAQEERDKKREEELQRKREEAAKKAQERKEKQRGILAGFMKKIKSVGESFEKGVDKFLADEENDDNKK